MSAAASDSNPQMQTYAVHYERVWDSGERTEHILAVRAYQAWAAETVFHWRVDNPVGLRSQKIIDIAREYH